MFLIYCFLTLTELTDNKLLMCPAAGTIADFTAKSALWPPFSLIHWPPLTSISPELTQGQVKDRCANTEGAVKRDKPPLIACKAMDS